jgi:pyruvate formate lyase activating enzyme
MTDHPQTTQVSLESASPYELRVDLGQQVSEAEIQAALATGDLGFMHSFTTGSTVDGPGVRVVAWLTGCQFRCLYCHNPDTWKLKNGIPVTVETARKQLSKYRQGLKIMKGGLTVSGGEPLVQDRFVLKLFDAAQSLGIHTALDTNGYLGSRLSDAELEKVDLVLLDIKAFDPERHRRLTGLDPAPVLSFARRLATLKKPVYVRYVLVPDLTDDPEEIGRIAEFTASLGNVDRVDVLPFHQMGAFKWKQLGMEYTLQDREPPTKEVVDRTCAQFKAAGLKAY